MSKLGPPTLVAACAALSLTVAGITRASAEAMVLIEADSGKVLHAENATYPWYPASLTKVMTAYVTLHAVKSNRLRLDSLLTVSTRAAAQQPSKMGFKPGTQVTVDNAIKMLMVKSANDIAVVLAEGVSGSIEQFAADMNDASRRLGMTQSHWVNPNGLPADNQISSARDLAILARAMLREFPEYDVYWNIPAIRFGKTTMRNTNSLVGRYPGTDGMKTGFICASGFNLVASATRGNRRLIAVMLGSPSSAVRGARTAGLLERGFNSGGLSWLTPSLGTVDSLQPINAAPPDLREEMCGKHRKRPAAEEADEEHTTVASADPNSPHAFMLSSLPPSAGKVSALLGPVPPITNPVIVHAGPAKRPAESIVAVARAKTDARRNSSRQMAATAPAQPEPPARAAPGQIAPPQGQFTRSNRGNMPGVGDSNTGWMSFAPVASAAPLPLTAAPPAAAAPRATAMPMPRPRPKAATRR